MKQSKRRERLQRQQANTNPEKETTKDLHERIQSLESVVLQQQQSIQEHTQTLKSQKCIIDNLTQTLFSVMHNNHVVHKAIKNDMKQQKETVYNTVYRMTVGTSYYEDDDEEDMGTSMPM